MPEDTNGPGNIHFSVKPTLSEFLARLEKDFEKIDRAFEEKREICVTVHILDKKP
jgi:hypothetical protein